MPTEYESYNSFLNRMKTQQKYVSRCDEGLAEGVAWRISIEEQVELFKETS